MSPWSPESILFGIGAAIMAIDQALSSSPSIKARFPNLAIPGPVKFAPFVLWLAALVFWWIGPVLPSGSDTATFVTGVNLKALEERRAGSTSFEYSQLEAPFHGAPVTVKGTVKDLSQDDGIAVVYLDDTSEGYGIDLRFRRETSSPVFRLRRGNVLVARCEFSSMAHVLAFLNKCELTSSS